MPAVTATLVALVSFALASALPVPASAVAWTRISAEAMAVMSPLFSRLPAMDVKPT